MIILLKSAPSYEFEKKSYYICVQRYPIEKDHFWAVNQNRTIIAPHSCKFIIHGWSGLIDGSLFHPWMSASFHYAI